MYEDYTKYIDNEIRERMQKRDYKEVPIAFEEVHVSQKAGTGEPGYDAEVFLEAFNYLNFNWKNSMDDSALSNHHAGSLLKRLLKRSVRFIIYPLLSFQNSYNACNVKCIEQLREYMAEMENYKKKIEVLEREICALKAKDSSSEVR